MGKSFKHEYNFKLRMGVISNILNNMCVSGTVFTEDEIRDLAYNRLMQESDSIFDKISHQFNLKNNLEIQISYFLSRGEIFKIDSKYYSAAALSKGIKDVLSSFEDGLALYDVIGFENIENNLKDLNTSLISDIDKIKVFAKYTREIRKDGYPRLEKLGKVKLLLELALYKQKSFDPDDLYEKLFAFENINDIWLRHELKNNDVLKVIKDSVYDLNEVIDENTNKKEALNFFLNLNILRYYKPIVSSKIEADQLLFSNKIREYKEDTGRRVILNDEVVCESDFYIACSNLAKQKIK